MGHIGASWSTPFSPFWGAWAWFFILAKAPGTLWVCLYPLQMQVPGNATSVVLGPLSSSTTYTVRVTCLYLGGGSSTLTGHMTTSECGGVGAGSRGGLHSSVQLHSSSP
jgi:hypothetical protein